MYEKHAAFASQGGGLPYALCHTRHSFDKRTRGPVSPVRWTVSCMSKKNVLRTLLQVMLYDDGEGDCITPEHVFDVLEADLKVR